jgi:hypothetical protein
MTHPPTDQVLGAAAAANVAFWAYVSERLFGRAWPGIAASVAAMASASTGCGGVVLELVNLPGNITVQVLSSTSCCGSCAIGAPCEHNCPTKPNSEAAT